MTASTNPRWPVKVAIPLSTKVASEGQAVTEHSLRAKTFLKHLSPALRISPRRFRLIYRNRSLTIRILANKPHHIWNLAVELPFVGIVLYNAHRTWHLAVRLPFIGIMRHRLSVYLG